MASERRTRINRVQRILSCFALLLTTLPAAAADVFLSLRTNYLWPTEFRYVRVELIDASDPTKTWMTIHAGTQGSDYLQGTRIAEFEDVKKKHDYYLVIQLLDGSTVPVAGGAWNFKATKRKSSKTLEVKRP